MKVFTRELDRDIVAPDHDDDVVLQVENLTSGYGDLAAVRDLSLTVRRGEIVALLGPNGAGKTTTLLTLIGELPLMSGTVRYQGHKVHGALHTRVQSGIAFVPEERSVFMGLSVMDNLKLGGNPEGVLELFPELKSMLRRTAGLLSGGEQQMIAVGRALASNPTLMLIDELSLGLAPLAVERLLDAVQSTARKQRAAVVLVEQQVRRALEVSDRWCLMRRGTLAASGNSDDTAELWENYVS